MFYTTHRCGVFAVSLLVCSLVLTGERSRAADNFALPKGAIGRIVCPTKHDFFRGVVFSPDRTQVITWHGPVISLWQIATGKEVWRVPDRYGFPPAFSPNGKVLVFGDWRNGIVVCDTATGRLQQRLCPAAEPRYHNLAYYALAFTPDGKVLVADYGTTLRRWDWRTGRELSPLRAPATAHSLRHPLFSPDGNIVAAQGRESIYLWCVGSGELFQEVPTGLSRCLAFSRDGRLLTRGYLKSLPPKKDWDPSILGNIPFFCVVMEVYELASGQPVLHITHKEPHDSHFYGMAFSPHGRLLASTVLYDRPDSPPPSHPGLRLWDGRTGQLVQRLKTNGGAPLGFSPDGKLLATRAGKDILFWDVSAIRRPEPKAMPLSPATLSRLWDDLASEDATVARRAVWALVAVPDQAVSLLRDHLKPTVLKNGKQLATLIRDLDSNDFEVREKATVALEDQGRVAASALRAALASDPPLEVRTRIERLLKRLGPPLPIRSPRVLRTIRAQEVLEYAGTAEAQKVLLRMAAGAPGAPETEDARAALARLARRTKTRR